MKPEERTKASTIEDMWIDIGVKNRAAALEQVRVGTTGVIDADLHEFPNGRIVSRSIDNRIGAYTVLEALRLAADRPAVTVAASAPVQEEINHAGGYTTAFQFAPQAAIIVDVTHATDFPNSDKKLRGEAKLGGGPALARGSVNSPVVVDMLVEARGRYAGGGRCTGEDPLHDEGPPGSLGDRCRCDALLAAGGGLRGGEHPQPLHALAQ